jgi:GNAT superfamily N-acetyltransferase
MARQITIPPAPPAPQTVTLTFVSVFSAAFNKAVKTLLERDGAHEGRVTQRTLNFYRQLAGIRPRDRRDDGHGEARDIRNGRGGTVHAIAATSASGEVLGFGAFAVINGQTEFQTFVVAPSARNSDLGLAIAEELIAKVRSLRGVTITPVEIGATNTPALRALVRAGLIPAGAGAVETRSGETSTTIALSLN